MAATPRSRRWPRNGWPITRASASAFTIGGTRPGPGPRSSRSTRWRATPRGWKVFHGPGSAMWRHRARRSRWCPSIACGTWIRCGCANASATAISAVSTNAPTRTCWRCGGSRSTRRGSCWSEAGRDPTTSPDRSIRMSRRDDAGGVLEIAGEAVDGFRVAIEAVLVAGDAPAEVLPGFRIASEPDREFGILFGRSGDHVRHADHGQDRGRVPAAHQLARHGDHRQVVRQRFQRGVATGPAEAVEKDIGRASHCAEPRHVERRHEPAISVGFEACRSESGTQTLAKYCGHGVAPSVFDEDEAGIRHRGGDPRKDPVPARQIFEQGLAAPIENRVFRHAELGPGDAIFYWCCQALFKYLPRWDWVFPRIAAAVPDACFVFVKYARGDAVTAVFRERLGAAFAAAGLEADRYCRFVAPLDMARFRAVGRSADVFLDSLGWSGCNTTLEALANDLPVVTMAGELMRGRHTTAILTMIGMPDMIARTPEEYAELAIGLGRDPEARQNLRRRIARDKHRLYRDPEAVDGLARYLEDAARILPPRHPN